MRIAFSIFKYFPFGGIQRDLMKVVRECQRRGIQVKVFTLRWEAPPEPDLEVEVMPVVGLNRHTQYENFASAVNLAMRSERWDLLVGFNKMPGLDVYYAGDSCYLEKSLTQRSALYRLLPRFRSFRDAELAVFGVHNDTNILTLSNNEVPRYRYYYRTPPERFHALPPGIERDRIAPHDVDAIRGELREQHGLADDARVVLFIGSGFIKKGLDRALLAVAALPDALRANTHLFVIGRDRPDGFQRLAMRLGIASQVTFYADGLEDVPRFMFGADALVHPAYDETAGMVIIEAMLAGVPAVVTRNCGYARYLERADAGIVLDRAFSQAALDQALHRLLTDSRREVWRRNGLAQKDNEQLFRLVPQCVDLLERFVAQRAPVLVFVLFKYFPFGGLQRDFMRIALACQSVGYRIVVYCLSWQGEVPEGFDVVVVPEKGILNHKKYQHFADYVRSDARWRRPVAVVGFNKMPGLDVYYAADSCFEHKAQEMRTALYRSLGRYKSMSRFERAVFGRDAATEILLIAPAQRAQFQRYYDTQDERMTLLPPGVSQDRARPANWEQLRSRVRSEFGLTEDDLLLVMIGSGFITKGLDRALLALASVPAALVSRTRMLIIGQDNPSQFMRMARSLKVDDRLIINRGRDDIPAVLQAADLMVHPAYMESGGMVLIEAIIAGLPVIATSVCGFAHYIADADAGVVVPEPFVQQTLNDAVANALQDSKRRSEWSRNGVSFGRAHQELYNMPAHAVRMIEQNIEARGRASARDAASR